MDIQANTLIAAGILALLWIGEAWLPFYAQFGRDLRARIGHDAKNLALGLVNAVLLAVVFGGAFALVQGWSEPHGFGLFRALAWPTWLETILVLLVFDLWMYLWHRANHVIPLLWRFHRMHHSDTRMDATTGVRFHTGEVCLSALARLAVVPLLGMELWQVGVYESIFFPVVLIHHSNVAIPRWLDYGLLALVVTPAMHRVHHSRLRPETDSNYGSVFPYWDMLLRSFRLREDPRTIELGLDEFDDERWQTFKGLMTTPFARQDRRDQRNRTRLETILAISAGATLLLSPALADDWTFFRGPRFDGVSSETGWAAEWPSSGPTIAWRKDVGRGVSSFAVAGDRAITMGNVEDRDLVSCFDIDDGALRWRFAYDCPFDDRNFEGGTASTPTIDVSYVYTLAYDGQLHCLRLDDGHLIWRKHLVDDFGGRYSSWKYAGSPLVIDDLVILDTGADGNSTVALDRESGRKVWGSGRDLAGYASPIPFERDGRRSVLVFKARAMVALDRATGSELWRIEWKTYYDVNASCPTVVGDKLFISSGYGGRSARGALFQLGDNPPEQIWLNDDLETKMNSGVVYKDHVYCVSERARGRLMCVALRDGRTVWVEPSFAPYGTLMIAGDKLVVLDEKGELVVADASPEGYHEISRAKVLEGRCWAMPVLANGRLLARNNVGKMVCLDLRAPSGGE